jgi:hypothetical protein
MLRQFSLPLIKLGKPPERKTEMALGRVGIAALPSVENNEWDGERAWDVLPQFGLPD